MSVSGSASMVSILVCLAFRDWLMIRDWFDVYMRGSTSVIELLKWSSSFGRVLRDLVAQLLMMSLTWVQR